MVQETSLDRFHRMVVVVCLIVAPLFLVVGMLVHPGEEEGGLIETLVSNPGRVEASSLLIIFSSLVFVPGLLGLVRYVPQRGRVLAHIGAGLATIGVISHAVWAGFQIVLLGLAQGGIDQTQLTTLVEGDPPNAAFIVVLAMFLVGFFLGLILLAGGLWRSTTFPKWAALGVGAVAVIDLIPLDSPAFLVIGPAIILGAFSAIALTVYRLPAITTVPVVEAVPANLAGSAQPQVQ